ncbi:hypothetical protein L208DRAFT_666750 [Tricholoma matsutake]|nr:hypothetical protein L208DRAFT_666750 [Tricholoma matsutake 945]
MKMLRRFPRLPVVVICTVPEQVEGKDRIQAASEILEKRIQVTKWQALARTLRCRTSRLRNHHHLLHRRFLLTLLKNLGTRNLLKRQNSQILLLLSLILLELLLITFPLIIIPS